nr:hypothetical protein [Tanacetum cinerariifolium]
MKQNRIIDDALRLYLFPYSLTHHATAWFDRLPMNSIHTFEEMVSKFLSKYFPPSMVTKLRNDISNFRQLPDEFLFEALMLLTQVARLVVVHTIIQSIKPPVAILRTFMLMRYPTMGEGVLPSNTVINPREDIKVITTRSGMTLAGPSVSSPPSYSSKEVERDPKTITDQMTLELATQSVAYPAGIAEDVNIQVGKFTFPVDFIVVDYNIGPQRFFVWTIVVNMYVPMDSWSDAVSCESLTVYNFLLEETVTFLSLDDSIPPGIDNDIYDSKRDILFLEELLDDDPTSDLPPHLPVFAINENGKNKSSIEDPPDLELKDLPPHLEYDAEKVRRHQSSYKLGECHFMVKEGIVLGHKISKSGIEVDRAKGIRSFLGHVGFYRRFIQDFSKIARPMAHLLEKDTPFFFSSEYQSSIEILKKKLTEAPILVYLDWDLPFEIMCDANDFAIGTVLGQRKEKHFQPIHYASKTLTDAHTHYTTTEKELLVVVYAFKKFQSYLVLSKTIRLENPHQGDLVGMKIDGNFPHESLNMIALNPDDEPLWICAEQIIKRCVDENEAMDILRACHHGPTEGHHGPTTPPIKFLTPNSSGPPFTEMPMTWSPDVTLVNIKEKYHKRMKCLRILSKMLRSLTRGASTLWACSHLHEGTNIYLWLSTMS